MKVIIYGATGMVGHGVTNAALDDDRVSAVIAVGRRPLGRNHPKLSELILDDVAGLGPHESRLRDAATCLFCLGVSSAGMDEAAYRRITYELTLRVAETLAGLNPNMSFVYVSGAATNAESRQMWARVKGETEQAIARLGFRATAAARPGYIQPVGGAVSRTTLYRALYAVAKPLYPLLLKLFPNAMIDSDELGRVLLQVGLEGAGRQTLETADLRRLADSTPPAAT